MYNAERMNETESIPAPPTSVAHWVALVAYSIGLILAAQSGVMYLLMAVVNGTMSNNLAIGGYGFASAFFVFQLMGLKKVLGSASAEPLRVVTILVIILSLTSMGMFLQR